MPSVNRIIWNKFSIHRGDNLPISAFHGGRNKLPELFNELGYKKGAEIGVEQGIFSEVICKGIPGVKLICVDPWKEYNRITQEMCDKYYQEALERLKPYDVEYKRMTSIEAVKTVPDESLDFVYIDGLHEFDPVMLDIILWSPKVRTGGIVSGHDFMQGYRMGVVTAVEAYTKGHYTPAWYITRGREPSWFWVKG